jgi:ABC-2 type transport system permease protein
MTDLFQSEWERIWARKKTLFSVLTIVVLLGFFTMWLARSGIGFYTPDLETQLNSLNFSTFLLKECGFVLTFIFIPMFLVDSFSGEYSSGALRLVLIRPHSRSQLLLSKWLSMAALLTIILAITFIFGQIAGWIFFPNVSETTFYPNAKPVSVVGAFGFSIMFYLTVYIIYIALLGLGSLISTVISNSILSFFLTIGSLIGTLYVTDQFKFFLLNGEITFKVLNGINTLPFLFTVLSVIVVTYGTTFFLWNRKNWVM